MNIEEKYTHVISVLSDCIDKAINRLPSLTKDHHCSGIESQASLAPHIEWMLVTRETHRNRLAEYQRAVRYIDYQV